MNGCINYSTLLLIPRKWVILTIFLFLLLPVISPIYSDPYNLDAEVTISKDVLSISGRITVPDNATVYLELYLKNDKISYFSPLIPVKNGKFFKSLSLGKIFPPSKNYKVKVVFDPQRQNPDIKEKLSEKNKVVSVVKDFAVGSDEEIERAREEKLKILEEWAKRLEELYKELLTNFGSYNQKELTEEEKRVLEASGVKIQPADPTKKKWDETEWNKWQSEWLNEVNKIQVNVAEELHSVCLFPVITLKIKDLIDIAMVKQVKCYKYILEGLDQMTLDERCGSEITGTPGATNPETLKKAFYLPYESILKAIAQERAPDIRDKLISDIEKIYFLSIDLIKDYAMLSQECEQFNFTDKKAKENFDKIIQKNKDKRQKTIDELSQARRLYSLPPEDKQFTGAFNRMTGIIQVVTGEFNETYRLVNNLVVKKVSEHKEGKNKDKPKEEEVKKKVTIPNILFNYKNAISAKVKEISEILGLEIFWLTLSAKDREIAEFMPQPDEKEIEVKIAKGFYDLEQANCATDPLRCNDIMDGLKGLYETSELYKFIKKQDFKLLDSNNYTVRMFVLDIISGAKDKEAIPIIAEYITRCQKKAKNELDAYNKFLKENQILNRCKEIDEKISLSVMPNKSPELTKDESDFWEKNKEQCKKLFEEEKKFQETAHKWSETAVLAIHSLGSVGEREALEYLGEYFTHQNPDYRLAAISSVANTIPVEKLEIVFNLIDDQSERIRHVVSDILRKKLGFLTGDPELQRNKAIRRISKVVNEYQWKWPSELQLSLPEEKREEIISKYNKALKDAKKFFLGLWAKHKESIIDRYYKRYPNEERYIEPRSKEEQKEVNPEKEEKRQDVQKNKDEESSEPIQHNNSSGIKEKE